MRLSLLALIAASTTTALAGLDSRLTRSFHGIAYSPQGVILPDCGATQEAVTADVLLLAQLTPTLRLYASDCGQTTFVFEAIKQTNADLSVWVGIYLPTDDTISTVFDRQWSEIESVLKSYGTTNVAGITVGNEFLLDSYGDSGTPTDTAGIAARTTLLSYVQKARTNLAALSLNKTIPIGTSDAGSAATLTLLEGVDYYQANVHPWFGSVDYEGAAAWTWNFFQEFDVDVALNASNNPTMYIAETGWPTSSDNASEAVNGANSPASIAGLQTFLDTFPCQANANGTEYFFFEFMDEPWKEIYGGVEPHWGLFYSNRTLKDLTLPNCLVTSPLNGTVSQLVFSASTNSTSTSSSSNSTSSTTSSTASAGSRSIAYGAGSAVTLVLGAIAYLI